MRYIDFIKHILLTLLLLLSLSVFSQVTVGSGHAPSEGAILDIKSQLPDAYNITSPKGGLLLSRVVLYNTTSLHPFLDTTTAYYPQEKKLHTGLCVYNIKPDAVKKLVEGIYQWNGTKWLPQAINEEIDSPWYEVGADIPATDNLKDAYLSAKVVIGGTSIAKINSGEDAVLTVSGGDASINDLTVGKGKGSKGDNTAFGVEALNANTAGDKNTAVGFNSLKINTTGSSNTAIGHMALSALSTGGDNTVIGNNAGNILTTGSNNIIIGNDIQPADGTKDNQLNIGNVIFGIIGSASTPMGKISIGKNAPPTSNLHVEGNMILKDADIIDGGEALLIDAIGNVGIGALLPSPTPHTFYQSEVSYSMNDNEVANFNNSTGFTIIWDSSLDALSNNMTDFQAMENSFKFNADYTVKISGYVGFQFIFTNNTLPVSNYDNVKANLGTAIVEIQMAVAGSSVWNTVASGYQVWYGAGLMNTVKVVQVPPAIVRITKDSRIRMVLKRATGLTIGQYNNSNHITKPGGAKYAKGLAVVAMSE